MITSLLIKCKNVQREENKSWYAPPTKTSELTSEKNRLKPQRGGDTLLKTGRRLSSSQSEELIRTFREQRVWEKDREAQWLNSDGLKCFHFWFCGFSSQVRYKICIITNSTLFHNFHLFVYNIHTTVIF